MRKYEVRYFDSSDYDVEWDMPTLVIMEGDNMEEVSTQFREQYPHKHLWAVDDQERLANLLG